MATTSQQALAAYQAGKITAAQYNAWAANPNSTIGIAPIAPAPIIGQPITTVEQATAAGAAAGLTRFGINSPQLNTNPLTDRSPAYVPTPVVATSVVDYLNSRQAPSDYETRKKMYETLGLASTYGDYRGSTVQNPALSAALANAENNAGVKFNATNIFDVIRAGQNPTVPPAGTDTTGTDTSGNIPENLKSALSDLTPEEIFKQATDTYTGSTQYKIQQDQLAADKTVLQEKAKSDTQNFLTQIASKGLAFSGTKTSGVSSIEVSKLADMLNVDRKYAMIIANGLESAAQDIAKQAQQGKVDALNSLEALGYTINPVTNNIERTLEGQRFDQGGSTTSQPTSYEEWNLAGGQQGTGMSYGSWLDRKSGGSGTVPNTIENIKAGIAGKGWDEAIGIVAGTASDATKAVHDRQADSVKANALNWAKLQGVTSKRDIDTLSSNDAALKKTTREELILNLSASSSLDKLTKQEIIDIVYGATKPFEPVKK